MFSAFDRTGFPLSKNTPLPAVNPGVQSRPGVDATSLRALLSAFASASLRLNRNRQPSPIMNEIVLPLTSLPSVGLAVRD